MNRTRLSMAVVTVAVVGVAVSAGDVSAAEIAQSFSYDWSSAQPQHQFSFDAFDDQGGTRILTAVTLGFAGTVSMELQAQTLDPAGIAAGEWSVEASHTVVAFFNGGKQGGLVHLQGIGGLVMDGVTGDLGGGGGEGGEPGEPFIAVGSLDLVSVVAIDPSMLPDFVGTGQHTGFMDGFFDGVVTPPEDGRFVDLIVNRLSQSGTVTLTYEYTVVPAPGTLVLMGAGGVVVCRRRRR